MFYITGPSPDVNTIPDLCEISSYPCSEDQLLSELVHKHVRHNYYCMYIILYVCNLSLNSLFEFVALQQLII